jgi:uncharacterized RDD family membrane protein YckC
MVYAGFWRRFGAFWLDFFCFLPIMGLSIWMDGQYRLFNLWYYIPGLLIGLWFYVYLIKRYGGTPGKLLLNMRIVKLDGDPVGYKEALVRYAVLFFLSAASSAAIVLASLKMTDSEYLALGWQERAFRLSELAPPWHSWVTVLNNIWIWGEFVVILTNKKRRAAHDFMAGTVVVRWPLTQQTIQADGSVFGGSKA